VPDTVSAYILIQTEVGKAASVAQQIASLQGVTLADVVAGRVPGRAVPLDDGGRLAAE